MLMMFDFKCTSCDKQFEQLVRKDVVNTECPECGHRAERKLSAPGGFQFKGNGYYCTDFKNKKG